MNICIICVDVYSGNTYVGRLLVHPHELTRILSLSLSVSFWVLSSLRRISQLRSPVAHHPGIHPTTPRALETPLYAPGPSNLAQHPRSGALAALVIAFDVATFLFQSSTWRFRRREGSRWNTREGQGERVKEREGWKSMAWMLDGKRKREKIRRETKEKNSEPFQKGEKCADEEQDIRRCNAEVQL